MPPTFFESAGHFRAWLEIHHRTATELIVGVRKLRSVLPSMTDPTSARSGFRVIFIAMEYKMLTLDDRIPRWKQIQMLFPEEPDWSGLEEEVLVKLIEEFEFEPSCATSAILYLGARNADRCMQLAHWLIAHPAADQWLKAAAADALENLR